MTTIGKLTAVAVALALSLEFALAAETGPASPNAGNTPLSDDSAYQAFGEKAALDRIARDFVGRIFADPRIGKYFQGADREHLAIQLASQFCYLLGGPCQYTGGDMRSVHAAMGVTQNDFNALAENLQDAMDKEGVSFPAQNRLIAKLAPMQRIIVTK